MKKQIIQNSTFLILFSLFLFPISLPDLDDRTYDEITVCEGGINDITHKPPPTNTLDRENGHVVFGDGQTGRRLPSENSKHEEANVHIVFGDGNQGVLTELCPDSTRT